jgi:hypothetical protein
MWGELQQPLQVLDNRIEGAILVIGGGVKLNPHCPLGHHLLFEGLQQAGFPNPSFPAEQHHLAFSSFRLFPPFP